VVESQVRVEDRPDRPRRTPWAAVIVFVLVSMGLAWLVALPLWFMDQAGPGFTVLFQPIAAVMMYTPAVATLVVVFLLRSPRHERMRFLGMWPLRPAKRVVWFMVGALFAPLVLVAAALGVSAALGWIQLDLVHFSGFREAIETQLAGLDAETAQLAAATMPPLGLLVTIQVAAVPFGALVNSVLAFGEEVGWRGWLVPALRPLGVWPALLISGAVWGLWHTPLILLGYNFDRTDWTGVALMTVGSVFWGVFFGWVRLRTASVWPAVIGHGALNASAGLFLVLSASGADYDMALVNPLGVSGWIVMAVLILILALGGQFKREPQLAPKRIYPVFPPTPVPGELPGQRS